MGATQQTSTGRSAQFVDGISPPIFTSTADANVSNTTNETTIIGTGVGNLTLPANFLVPGRTIRINAVGYMSDQAAPTINIRVKFGSTVIAATGATGFSGGLTNQVWDLLVLITCRTTGASGTVAAQGHFTINAANIFDLLNLTDVTVDTTASQTIDATAQWNVGVSANTITCTNFVAEALGG